ncbi:hypothetical protein [Paenibacillus radicis (ex Gao et al. 2016)]|uniref:Uncharacterized protein n=1 Tax=Paenibacillus radicis (ex Gao et al. 2016) TaxID=1737354 RepID=A0A917HTD2_9BACL|nr:hypothetical protein [Paenibacillus radicis (ex Gao et al. 2016)]GGG88610.1 hypothetical protein GCM10010918_53990 [Paenibacillus radicis (ex Gao et al. 2016)]
MTSEISFGVGCFNFGMKAGTTTTIGGYFNELQNTFEAISNISEIKIELDEEDYDFTAEISISTYDNMSVGGRINPNVRNVRISFDIFIPKRIQEDLKHDPKLFKTEKFRVVINYTYYFPVVIVQPFEPYGGDVDPSSAVVLVREFLIKEFLKIESFIDFQVLGPSPFHGDFFVKENNQLEEKFQISIMETKAYDEINIYYNGYTDVNEAFEDITLEILEEFGFFYELMHKNLSSSMEWSFIEQNLDVLISLKQERKKSKNLFLINRILNDLFINISYFEKDQIFYKSYLQKNRRNIIHFSSYIDREINEQVNYPTSQVTELIKLYENQKLNVNVILATVIAAISGGVMGAVITALFT